MEIVLNGEPHTVAEGVTVLDLVQSLRYGTQRFAVEVNEEVISRNRHDTHVLQSGDRVEIVHAVGGG